MPDKPGNDAGQTSDGLRVGSWLGAAASALGLGACITVVNLGGMAVMDAGGFVASGGPYEISRPMPQGLWIVPVAFIGIWVFPVAHAAFASRIKGFGLIFATWCTVWTSIGATTLWYGFYPPGGGGLAWGWLIMGGIFLLVGLGSTWLYVDYLRSPDPHRPQMPAIRRMLYAAMIAIALGAGVFAGFRVFAAATG